jgi:hypothetical protein
MAATAAAFVAAGAAACSPGTRGSAGTSASPPAAAASTVTTGTARPGGTAETAGQVRIQLTVGSRHATATLRDNATARDFASLLPVTLSMGDLFGREKPGALPRPLTAGHGQSAYQAGDLGYWSPGHELAIYYRDDGQRIPAPGIVIIGRIDSGLSAIATAGDTFQLRITRLDPP